MDAAKADLMKAALGAGALLYAGVLALVAALVLFVLKFVAPWVAALLVGVAVLGLGYALFRIGEKRKCSLAQAGTNRRKRARGCQNL